MNDCGNCRHTNHLDLPDFSTMPCAACARYGADNDPTMWEAKPITNYDRIISKSPEELAKWIVEIADCDECEKMHGFRMCGAAPEKACEDCWLDWLKQEATE